MTLDSRAGMIVFSEWIFFALATFILMTAMVFDFHGFREHEYYPVIVILVSVGLIFSLALNILLSIGILKRHRIICKTWYFLMMVSILLQVFNSVVIVLHLYVMPFVFTVAILAYRSYAVYTIFKFSESLKVQANSRVICKNNGRVVVEDPTTSTLYSSKNGTPTSEAFE